MLGKALCSRERSHQPFPKSSLPEPTSPLQLPAQAPGRGMFLLPSPESPAPGGKNSTGRPPKGDTPHFYMENSDLVSKVNMTHVTVRNAFSCKKKKKRPTIVLFLRLFIYLFRLCWVFVAVCRLFSHYSKWGLLSIAQHRLLIGVPSFVVEHGL